MAYAVLPVRLFSPHGSGQGQDFQRRLGFSEGLVFPADSRSWCSEGPFFYTLPHRFVQSIASGKDVTP